MHDKKLNVMNFKYFMIAENLSSYQKKLYLMRCFNMESFNYISNNSWIKLNYFFCFSITSKLQIDEINQDLRLFSITWYIKQKIICISNIELYKTL